MIIYPPKPPARIKKPVIEQFTQCGFRCMSGHPECGCWNDYLMSLHYGQEKFYSPKDEYKTYLL